MSAVYTYGDGAIVVFGGSGGLGSYICRAFAQAGCNVALTYRSAAGAAEQLQEDLARSGVRVSAHQVDIVDPAQVEACLAAVGERYGTIHTIVYAAGPHID